MLRFFGTVFVLALIVLVVGVAIGWFDLRRVDAGERSSVQISVDEERVKRDAAAVKDRVRNLGTERDEDAPSASRADRLLHGTLVAVDAAAHRIEVDLGAAGRLPFEVPAAARVELDGEPAGLAQLARGDRVDVGLDEGDAGQYVVSVSARRK
jgi:hypothetical protein